MSDLVPKDCPKYETCNAAICPLDPLWRTAVHLAGEKVCPYLLASGKSGAEDKHRDDPVFPAVLAVLPEVVDKHTDIRKRIEVAARSGFKGGNHPENLRTRRTLEQTRENDLLTPIQSPQADLEPASAN